MLWEMMTDKKVNVEPYIRDVVCTMVQAVLARHIESSHRSRTVEVIGNVLGPLMTYGYFEVCCKSLQKICYRVKEEMLMSK